MSDSFLMTRELEKRLEDALVRLGYPVPYKHENLLGAFDKIAYALEDCADRLEKAGLNEEHR